MTIQENATRWPLAWPTGWRRTPSAQRRRARFLAMTTSTGTYPGGQTYTRTSRNELSVAAAIKRLEDELRLLGATDEILSTNIAVNLNGLPRSGQREPTDPGVAVYFRLKKEPRCLACDRWDRVAGNIAALAAHIDAIRRIDRYGVGTLEQAFAGYKALPATAVDWWIILGLPQTATLDQVEDKFRELARKAHPDTGGTHDTMSRLTAAREAARKVLA